MKPRVINGKRYNPSAANLIGEADGLSLYRKTTGEYFATENNEYILLDNEQAQEIGKRLLSDKEYVFEFEVRTSDGLNLSLLVPRPIRDKLAERSEQENKSIKEIVTDILFDNLF